MVEAVLGIGILSSVLLSVVKRYKTFSKDTNNYLSILLPILFLFSYYIYLKHFFVDVETLVSLVASWLVTAGFYDKISRWFKPTVNVSVGRGNTERGAQLVGSPQS